MSVINITKENFDSEVINSDKPVLVDFYADWCSSCRAMENRVSEISEEESDIKVAKINIESEPELAKKYDVKSIPTFKAFKNGDVVNTSVGVSSKSKLVGLAKNEAH